MSMSTESLEEKWKMLWPSLGDVISRLIFAALVTGVIGFSGWALQRNNALDDMGTFLTITGASLIGGLFRAQRETFDDIDPRSRRGRLIAWARYRPLVTVFAGPKVFRILGAIAFGGTVMVLEKWVHSWFGEDPAHPSLTITLLTLAIVLVPAYTWTGHLSEMKLGRSKSVDELGGIIADIVRLRLDSPLGRSFLFALIRTALAMALRIVAVILMPIMFNTPQATVGASCFVALLMAFYDTISAAVTRGPAALKTQHALMIKNAALEEQVATLRAQVAVLQSMKSQ